MPAEPRFDLIIPWARFRQVRAELESIGSSDSDILASKVLFHFYGV